MLKSVEGVYREGKVELLEVPDDVSDETQVIVTFLSPKLVDLRKYRIEAEQAAELRDRLAAFAEEWESPEMDVYDDYDTHKAHL